MRPQVITHAIERHDPFFTEEGLIEHSPAVHARKPRLDHESHAVGLDRNEVGWWRRA